MIAVTNLNNLAGTLGREITNFPPFFLRKALLLQSKDTTSDKQQQWRMLIAIAS
jgi:hypothetical protein